MKHCLEIYKAISINLSLSTDFPVIFAICINYLQVPSNACESVNKYLRKSCNIIISLCGTIFCSAVITVNLHTGSIIPLKKYIR